MFKAAVIGLGNIGMQYDFEPQRPHPSTHVFAYEMSSEFQLVCGIDGDIKKESDFIEVSPKAKFYSTLGDALRDGGLDDIDVISICTPPSSHFDIIQSLVAENYGNIIFCEKPIVQNDDEARMLQELVDETGVMIIPNISRRWNTELRKVADHIKSQTYGKLQKIHVRYTRGIYNTGAHLFDLLRMWSGNEIKRVFVLGETNTTALPEKSYSFYFEQSDGVTGFVEAMDDNQYYLFEIDLYFERGKIEMRNSGDDIIYYSVEPHHLFQGHKEFRKCYSQTGILNDACIKNAIENINNVLNKNEEPYCLLYDAIYPLYVAITLEKSYKSGKIEEVILS